MGNITQYNQVKDLDDLREFTAMVARMTRTDLRVDQPHGEDTCCVVIYHADGRPDRMVTTLRKIEDVAEQLERWYNGFKAAEDRLLLLVAQHTLGPAENDHLALREDGDTLLHVELRREKF